MHWIGLAFLLWNSLIVLAPAPQTHASAGIWLDVPFVRQPEDGCGAASISMLLQYWNAHGTAMEASRSDTETIRGKLFSRKAHGIFATDLERYVRDSGFRTFSYEGNWDDLRQHLMKGRPLIVGLQPGKKTGGYHYVVVAGMDWQGPAVFVNDPARGKLIRIERADFEREWQPLRNWMLLAVPQHSD